MAKLTTYGKLVGGDFFMFKSRDTFDPNLEPNLYREDTVEYEARKHLRFMKISNSAVSTTGREFCVSSEGELCDSFPDSLVKRVRGF